MGTITTTDATEIFFKDWGSACRFRKSTLRTPSGSWN